MGGGAMISCPKCGNNQIRVHGALQVVEWARLRWFGPVVPRGTTVAVECSCGNCLCAFTAKRDGSVVVAPLQQAHDALRMAQERLSTPPEGKGQTEKEAQPARPQARPAPDPRNRKR